MKRTQTQWAGQSNVIVRIDYSVVVEIEAIAVGATIRPAVAVAAAGHTVVVEGKLVAGVDIQPTHPRLSVDHAMSNKRVQYK